MSVAAVFTVSEKIHKLFPLFGTALFSTYIVALFTALQ